jgi:hypothetical protein
LGKNKEKKKYKLGENEVSQNNSTDNNNKGSDFFDKKENSLLE